jgi:predicted phage tail protein
MMLRTIRIYGRLAKFLKRRKFEAEVTSAAEAVRFLLANFPHLEPELAQGHYRVSVGGYDLGEQELHDPAGQQEIKIIPVVAGAGAVGRIIAGVALIALTIATGGFGGAAIGLFGTGTLAVGTIGLAVGASLVLGGVAQLLTPVPKMPIGADSEKDPRKSYSFSGVQQTSREGVPVPIVYGETLVGSVVISAGIDTVQVTA